MKYLYELIGTFFLMLTIGLTVVSPGAAGPLAPLAIGSVLAVMVYAGGHVSGGHYNPAVSLAVFLRKRLSVQDLGYYWISQLVGAILAAFVTIYLKGGVSLLPPLELNVAKSFLAEFLFTFALCYVVLNVATAKGTAGNSYFGWAIGFTVLAGAFAVGSISGAAFNPAVAVGVSLLHLITWTDIWIFFAANFLGAAAAALLFNAAHRDEV